MPEEQDAISESLAVAQQANALLNRIRREEPELWQRLWLMPDGLRTAITAVGYSNAGSTLTLVTGGKMNQGYAVNSDGAATELTHAELVRQVECEPDTMAVPLPPDTNTRVGAAVAALAERLSPTPIALEPRQRDDRIARYVNTQLAQLRLDHQADASYLRHTESLRVAFNAELPVSVNQHIMALMREGAEGRQLSDALAAMMSELPRQDADGDTQPPPSNDVHVVCSMGIVAT